MAVKPITKGTKEWIKRWQKKAQEMGQKKVFNVTEKGVTTTYTFTPRAYGAMAAYSTTKKKK